MTEKVVSLSGGLLLGMVFALFLGIGATQSIPASSHFEMPNFMPMTIAQNTQAPSTPANDTTPSVNVATPTNPDRGRITRIATLEATTDPVFEPATTTEIANAEPKSYDEVFTPKIDNSLQRTNLQRSSVATSPQNYTYIALGSVVARQNSYEYIADNAPSNSPSPHNPAGIDGKPQTHGSPAIAHNDPNADEGSPVDPDFESSGAKPKPDGSDPDISNNDSSDYIDSGRPHNDTSNNNNNGDGTEHGPGNYNPRPSMNHNPRPQIS